MTSKKQHSPESPSRFAASRSPALPGQNNVAAYAAFAEIYDDFMDHVPYGGWAAYLLRCYRQLQGGRAPAALADLGCGTGRLLEHLPRRMQLHGLDGSAEMLARARRRLGQSARLRQGRLQERLPFGDGQLAWLCSTHDSLNYLTDPADLRRHFSEAARVLAPDGLYSMDLVSLNNILQNFDGRRLEHRVGGRRLVWNNRYDRQSRLMRSELEFETVARSGTDSARILREVHTQRYYSIPEVTELAAWAGLRLELTQGDYEPREHTADDHFWNLHLRRLA